jgi:HAD superfamily hydrolase (TIGR01450 family)
MSVDLSRYETVLFDLDGTVYHEEHALPGAAELVRKFQAEQRRFACLSNSADSPLRLMDRLNTMGMDLEPDNIYSAGAAACDYVLENFPRQSPGTLVPGSSSKPRVFELSTESVHEMLDGQVDWVHTGGEPCDVVLSGAPSNFYNTAERRRIALLLLRHGAALVAVCADRVYPSPRGLEFGSGSMAAMLSYAANVKPVFCGKPERIFFMELCHRLKIDPASCVLIGDNVESDVVGAKTVGMATVLVLSGVTRRKDLRFLSPQHQPDFVVEDLSELLK